MTRYMSVVAPLACLAAGIFSTVVFWKEMAVFGRPVPKDPSFFSYMINGKNEPALSFYSKRLILDDCYTGMLTPYSVSVKEEIARAFDRKCSELSGQIAASVPASSYAWAMNAAAYARTDDQENFLAAYKMSRKTGPNEQPIADMRMRIAERNYARLDEEALAAHENDLKMMARSYVGIRAMAMRYALDPGFRERITTIVEQMPANEQWRFLTSVRSEMRAIRIPLRG